MEQLPAPAMPTSCSSTAGGGGGGGIDASGSTTSSGRLPAARRRSHASRADSLHEVSEDTEGCPWACPPPQKMLLQWLAGQDAATQRHAAGVLAAVNLATAISMWLAPQPTQPPPPQLPEQPLPLPATRPPMQQLPCAQHEGQEAAGPATAATSQRRKRRLPGTSAVADSASRVKR